VLSLRPTGNRAATRAYLVIAPNKKSFGHHGDMMKWKPGMESAAQVLLDFSKKTSSGYLLAWVERRQIILLCCGEIVC
jgi:hypothetical protein